jgi:hypothetical protein
VGRSDASHYARGIVIYQIAIIDGKRFQQLIGVASHKFSKQAFKWGIHKKAAYSMVFLFRTFALLLAAKETIIQTDHQNLK